MSDLVGAREIVDEGRVVGSVSVEELDEAEWMPITSRDDPSRQTTAQYLASVADEDETLFASYGDSATDALARLADAMLAEARRVQRMMHAVAAYADGKPEL